MSNTIKSHSYNEDTQDLTLVFFYAPDTKYIYHCVPQDIYFDFANSESLGKALATMIKKVFEFTKEQN